MKSPNQASIQAFLEKFPRAQTDKPLAPFSTFNIGGPADIFYEPATVDEIPLLIHEAETLKIPYLILGGGSNTIFADAGFRGLIIRVTAKTLEHEEQTVIADAGALLSQVIQFALKQNLSGLEKLTGLPGTIGGAVRGNAGAYGTEIKDVFEKALLFTPGKGLHEEPKAYFDFGYRDSVIKKNDDIILRAYLRLKPCTGPQAMDEAKEILTSRISKQPKGKCSGSFFKNPTHGAERSAPNNEDSAGRQNINIPNLTAGYLLDQAGCKGLQIGQVQVSPLHANWLINLGGGTQKDVIELAQKLQATVKQKFNIELEREVQLVGEIGILR